VFVFAVVLCVNFLDRGILPLLVVPIKRDLGLTDTEISLLMGFAFVMFYVILGLPIARLVDRSSRRRIIGIGVALMADTIAPAPGALASLKPQLNLPAAARGPLLLALPVLVASWALAGFYGSLGPMLVRAMLGVGSALLGGLALFALAASAGLAVLVLQHREPRAMMTFGASLLAAAW